MSSLIAADQRLFNIGPEHYAKRENPDGKVEKVLVGPYTLEQRDAYFDIMASLYLTRHPKAERKVARTSAFNKWRMVVFATLQAQARHNEKS